jgi:hypothetical protein
MQRGLCAGGCIHVAAVIPLTTYRRLSSPPLPAVVMLVGNKADLHEQRHLETAAAAHAQATR